MRSLLLVLFACGPAPRLLVVDAIEVTGVDDEYTDSLELEVHLYRTGGTRESHVGCAGQMTGLEDADLSDTLYRPNAHFLRAANRILEFDDVRPGTVRFIVTEDDRSPCPVEQDATFRTMPTIDNEDDLVATSSIVDVASLDAGTELSFGNVVRLSIAVRSD